MTLDFAVGAQRLRVISITQTREVDLDDFKSADERLVMLVPVELMLDDGIVLYSCFNGALGEHGLLASVRADDLVGLASDLAMPADVAAGWVRESNVTVAVLNGRVELVAAVVLAAETTVGDALEAVRERSPHAPMTADEQVTVSVAKDHMVLRRALHRRRLELVAQGRSPWEAQ